MIATVILFKAVAVVVSLLVLLLLELELLVVAVPIRGALRAGLLLVAVQVLMNSY
jgi:hypothetical protein